MSSRSTPAEFELVRDGDVWVATHVETGVASQGDTPNEAVAMAQEAVHLHRESHQPGDADQQRAMLDRFDIDEDDVAESIDSPSGMP